MFEDVIWGTAVSAVPSLIHLFTLSFIFSEIRDLLFRG